jgi:hypothetical protein
MSQCRERRKLEVMADSPCSDGNTKHGSRIGESYFIEKALSELQTHPIVMT